MLVCGAGEALGTFPAGAKKDKTDGQTAEPKNHSGRPGYPSQRLRFGSLPIFRNTGNQQGRPSISRPIPAPSLGSDLICRGFLLLSGRRVCASSM